MLRRAFVRSTLAAAAVSVPGARSLHALYRVAGRQEADVAAVTLDGQPLTLKGEDISALAEQIRGSLLLARHAGYDEARLILNPTFDKRPALVVQPTGVADIQSAVHFAREHRLLTAVKCGGHSISGQSTCDRGMLVDLSRFRAVRVDSKARRAWVAGGTLLGQLDYESMAQGLVTPMGTVSHTGIAGLTLGGGFGRVARRFGLAIDNLMSVDIVTADGEVRHASGIENEDLYWAVRGGGGNFGIVTALEFRLHPMQREVISGNVVFPLARARDVLNMYADFAPRAADQLYFDPFMALPPGGEPGVVGVHVCYSGPLDQAERVLGPIRRLGTPLEDGIKAMDYVDVQRAGDIDDPRAMGFYFKGGFIGEMPETLVSALVDGFEGHPARATQVFFQIGGGAIGRVANDATAFSHRYAMSNMMTAVTWPMGDESAEHIAWLRQYWSTLESFTGGFYANDMPLEATGEMINANYRENYARLVQVKNTYDPMNLFRMNANVRPTV